jgi:hypothetical protein
MAIRDTGERRIYILPPELMERIKAYQARNGITAEVEAVRRLLDMALQMNDSVQDILRKLQERQKEEKDPRILIRDVLATHTLVEEMSLFEGGIKFRMRDNMWGKLTREGRGLYGEGDNEGYVHRWNDYPEPEPFPQTTRERYQAKKKTELDDDIPF